MDSFIRYEDTLLLEYQHDLDYYWISYDSGTSYPYELYEYVSVDGVEHYIIYLEDKGDVPTGSRDVWVAIEDVLAFVRGYTSTTETGVDKMKALEAILGTVLGEL